jgi:F-type H+-transporting ATPase subunit gamma
MANRRVLVRRRKSVRNIRKITRTMQLIATARFQAAMNRATASKPYTEKLAELVRDIAGASERVDHPLLKPSDAKRSACVILTSMRGLCGGYNASVLRSVVEHLNAQRNQGLETDVYMVGKKGIAYFRFLKRDMHERITDIGDVPRFERVERIANGLMDRFIEGEVSSVHVAYMRFHSASRQRPEVMQLLPLSYEPVDDHAGEAQGQGATQAEYEFSPDPESLLNELLPATVRIRLFQAFNEAAVSEQIARMVAMKAATDAAGDMITSITRQYNRARQTQITMELLDIVGGANALA